MSKCEVWYLSNLIYTIVLQNTADFSFLSLLHSVFHSLFFFFLFPYGNHLLSDPVIPVSDRDTCVKLLHSITNISPDDWCGIPPDLLTFMYRQLATCRTSLSSVFIHNVLLQCTPFSHKRGSHRSMQPFTCAHQSIFQPTIQFIV
jgi:hypothetical protein